MSKNIYNQFFDLQVHLPGIVILHKFEIFHKHGRIYRFEGKFNKNSEDRWRPNNFMQSLSVFFLFFDGKKRIYHLNFYLLSTLDSWILLICLALDLKKRYTLRLFLMCLEERSFRSCSPWGNGGQMTHLGERCDWGVLGVEENYAN